MAVAVSIVRAYGKENGRAPGNALLAPRLADAVLAALEE